MKKTLNPNWGEKPTGLYQVGRITASDHEEVRITCYDYDVLSKADFMGVIRIPVAALFDLGPGIHDKWVPVRHRNCRLSESQRPLHNTGKSILAFARA